MFARACPIRRRKGEGEREKEKGKGRKEGGREKEQGEKGSEEKKPLGVPRRYSRTSPSEEMRVRRE